MTSRRQALRPLRAGVLLSLVLAVLAGLVGMHGLGPVSVFRPRHTMPTPQPVARPAPLPTPRPTALPATHPTTHPVTRRPTSRSMVHGHGHTVSPPCDHQDGGGSHVHADSTCAAGGVSGGPVLSLPAGHVVAPVSWPVAGRAFSATDTGRAPPSLSRLQLLRI